MTLRSRVNQRSQHPIARAARAASRRRQLGQGGARVTVLRDAAGHDRDTQAEAATDDATPAGPALLGSGACWDAPCSALRAEPAPPRRVKVRRALSAVPTDWSAVRAAAS